jgi:hypothetical protein
LNGRVSSVLIAGLVCLMGAGTLGLYASPAAAAKPSPAVRAEKANTAIPATATAAVPLAAAALMSDAVAVSTGVSPKVLHLAVSAVSCAVASGDIDTPRTLTVIDYSLPSVTPRLWVFEVATGKLLFKELVAHGRNTGENMATDFSDTLNSRQSSIGLFVTGDTYVGSNGYSLRLDGLEPGFNARARERAIVMHGAPYVDESLAASQGRIGRSWGCPALREAVARNVIDTVRGGGVIFSYYPDQKWLETSRFLNCRDAQRTVATS